MSESLTEGYFGVAQAGEQDKCQRQAASPENAAGVEIRISYGSSNRDCYMRVDDEVMMGYHGP